MNEEPIPPEVTLEQARAIIGKFAAENGRKGGQSTSEKKLKASRKNAKKGGWKKGVPRKPKPPSAP